MKMCVDLVDRHDAGKVDSPLFRIDTRERRLGAVGFEHQAH